MKISKVFNNNCVASLEGEQELIVTGSGIGFQKKPGDEIDESKIEKTFKIVSNHQEQFEQLLNYVSIDYFETTRTIVEHAQLQLGRELNDSVNVPLTDHIASAIDRYKENILLPNVFLNDFKLFYPQEYEIGEWSLNYINECFDVELPQDEIAYFAMHIINASEGKGLGHSQKTIYFIKDIVTIIENELEVSFNVSDLAYQRLTTHLKYLSYRIVENENNEPLLTESEMDDLSLLLLMRLKKYDPVVRKIVGYIKQKYDYDLTVEEQLYINIHIYQLMKRHRR